jgi:hypothetical protein
MKYLVSILLIVLLTGCHMRAGNTAQKISAVSKCASLCASAVPASIMKHPAQPEEPVSVVTTSLLERTGQILTW